jgi:hypothetical protein
VRSHGVGYETIQSTPNARCGKPKLSPHADAVLVIRSEEDYAGGFERPIRPATRWLHTHSFALPPGDFGLFLKFADV